MAHIQQSDFRQKIENYLATLVAKGKDSPKDNPKDGQEKVLKGNFITTPLGDMLALADDEYLHMLEFCDLANLEARLIKLKRLTPITVQFARKGLESGGILAQLEAELSAYFAGKSPEFSVKCAFSGTDFSKEVWSFLRKIPVATTCSYAEQAAAVGRPKAYRAVARANSQNRIAIIVPCHRVIGADGSLTGYAGGLQRKRWLLAHERQYFH